MSDTWISEGAHWQLNFEHAPMEGAGSFTGGGWKLCWHTTQSPRDSVDSMVNVLRAKRAAPHFVIGMRDGFNFPVVVQCLGLDESARALEHDAGTPETNRANCIQIEVCGYAETSALWSDNWLKALANLTNWIQNRVPIPFDNPRSFANPTRYTGWGWVQAKGHVGHSMCPGNVHWDPGDFRCARMLSFARDGFQELQPRG